jgi:hypothetical protein
MKPPIGYGSRWMESAMVKVGPFARGGKSRVELVTTPYQTGMKLTKEAMEVVETQLQRLPFLEKWFVDIRCSLPDLRDT